MSTFPLRQYLILEMGEMLDKYIYIYKRVNIVRLEREILTGKYQLSFFGVRRELERIPIKMDQLTFFFIGSRVSRTIIGIYILL